MATLHFIYGLPGSGKTSLARRLSIDLPATMFCEDEYLATYLAHRGRPVADLADFLGALREVRKVIEPLALAALRTGSSVVFDFAGNTVAHRAWARSVAEAAGAAHLLHVLDVPLEECRRRVQGRNADKPAGLYFGDVSDAMFDMVVPHIVPPTAGEGMLVTSSAR